MTLQFAYFGNPILRKKAKVVEEINDDLRTLIHEMTLELENKNGLGLAAPQVSVSLRLFITKVPTPNEQDPETWEDGILRVFINPELSNPGEDVWVYEEGCLSIPGIYVPVVRPYTVQVEWTDIDGSKKKQEFSGLEARCIMHENDHINGVLMIDRTDPQEKKQIEAALRKVKAAHQND